MPFRVPEKKKQMTSHIREKSNQKKGKEKDYEANFRISKSRS